MAEITNKSEKQKGAEADVEGFRSDLGPFVVAAEKTRMAMVFMDAKAPGNPIIFANDAFLSLSGYDRKEVLGQTFDFLVVRGDDSKAMGDVAREFESGSDEVSEILCRRKDGGEFWAGIFVSPVRDGSGDIVQHFASFVDLTRYKQEQVQSHMLIDELNHRVKNTLSTVQAIVWQALRTGTDLKVRDAIETRLFALSRSHDLLSREHWRGAGLFDLVRDALEPFGVAGSRAERIAIKGENIRVPPNVALALGIAFHELATNAVKYGALSNEAGSLAITWGIEPKPDGARLILHWQEKDGPPVVAPTRKGYGSRVIERGLTYELGGSARLDYRPDGVACAINFPAPGGPGNG
jgi:PAS domain S-box-containing protein